MKNMAHFICFLNVGFCFCSLFSEVQYTSCTKCKYFFEENVDKNFTL